MTQTIAVFGLGYVGCVSVACLAKLGHSVIGIDINPYKVELINQGKPTVIEKNLSSLMEDQFKIGRISATTSVPDAMARADVSIVCVGTPSDAMGNPNLQSVWHVAEQIGKCLINTHKFHTIAIRSTTPPKTCSKVEDIISRLSDKVVEKDFTVVSNPEFLREGSSIHDYFHPPYTILGTHNEKALRVLRQVYGDINAPIVETDRETAEILKYIYNTYHALKVVFANEVAAICKAIGIDSHKAMDLFCQDNQLNISSVYFKPGFAFGGSCLPKDLRALNALSRSYYIDVPVISEILHSNALQIERAMNMIAATGKKRVGVLGLAFKDGTDDLRESPVVELLERLLGKGYDLVIHDQNVMISRIAGANKQYIEARFPHIAKLLVRDLNELQQMTDVVVVTQNTPEYKSFIQEVLPIKMVIDLVRIFDTPPNSPNYQGIGW